MKFRPDIEGLRAVAVVPVVAFHVWPSAVPGGFVGVDIFFVISGYLITSLLMQRLQSNSYSILAFYGARIRRIVPALFVMLAASSAAAFALLPPAQLKEFARTLGATSIFLSNIELNRVSDYFAGSSDLKPLLHTWSLAVEEQFYIVFPPLLALLFHRTRRSLLPTLAIVALLSFAWNLWLVPRDPSEAFYFAPPRAFELLVGSMLAVVELERRASTAPVLRETAAAAGLLMIGVALFTFSGSTPFPGWAALLPVCGACLLIWSGGGVEHRPTSSSLLLRSTPVRWIGLLSYSLYLWHWPVIVFTRHFVMGEPGPATRVLAVVASVVLAALSVRFIERPFRHLHSNDRRLLTLGTGCIVAAGVVSVVTVSQEGFRTRFDETSLQLFAASSDSNPRRSQCHGRPGHSIPYAQRCVFGGDGRHARIAVWGDSHGAELAWALGELTGPSGGGVAEITSSSCPPALQYHPPRRPACAAHNEAMAAALAADASVDTVVLVARYALYAKNDALSLESGLRRTIAVLTDAGKRVVLIKPIPDPRYPVPAAAGLLLARGQDPAAFGPSREQDRAHHQLQIEMLQRLAARPGVLLYSASDALCTSGQCLTVIDGVPLYFDDNHLSVRGAQLIGKDLLARLAF